MFGKYAADSSWTVLAAIVLEKECPRENDPKFKVLSLATGTRCLGKSKIDSDGFMLVDCHAEILAKRSLQRILLK